MKLNFILFALTVLPSFGVDEGAASVEEAMRRNLRNTQSSSNSSNSRHHSDAFEVRSVNRGLIRATGASGVGCKDGKGKGKNPPADRADLPAVGPSWLWPKAKTFAMEVEVDKEMAGEFEWTLVTDDADWGNIPPGASTYGQGRAGLEAVQMGGDLYVVGGRTSRRDALIPGDSLFFNDVYKSSDFGETWTRIESSAPFAPRAYFEMVTKDYTMFVLGGQDLGVFCAICSAPPTNPPTCTFVPAPRPEGCTIIPNVCAPPFEPTPPNVLPPCNIPVANVFNDTWSSPDGKSWTELTTTGPKWEARGGHVAIVFDGHIYVMAGTKTLDTAIGGPPVREYFNDVWRSSDGRDWEEMTAAAPWAARAGPAVVVKGHYLYLLGGEAGFIGNPPPYFNDVWRTLDGTNWEKMTDAAGWSPRPGHVCHVVEGSILCFGGFGIPANPIDIWESKTNGRTWTQVQGTAWNAAGPEDGKYDFDSLNVRESSKQSAIYTFGGDRETFDFEDPTNYLKLDRDVWRYGKEASSYMYV